MRAVRKPKAIVGLRGKCPRCAEGSLFKGFLSLSKVCEHCGLDFEFAESGDGPAFFIMMLVGFVVMIAMFITEISYQPPYWVHAVIWLPLILILSAGLLRPLKGLMIALQYKHQAGEGRLDQ